MTARISYEGMDETIDHMERMSVLDRITNSARSCGRDCAQSDRCDCQPTLPTCSACAHGVCQTPVACERAEDQSLSAPLGYRIAFAIVCIIVLCVGAGLLLAHVGADHLVGSLIEWGIA